MSARSRRAAQPGQRSVPPLQAAARLPAHRRQQRRVHRPSPRHRPARVRADEHYLPAQRRLPPRPRLRRLAQLHPGARHHQGELPLNLALQPRRRPPPLIRSGSPSSPWGSTPTAWSPCNTPSSAPSSWRPRSSPTNWASSASATPKPPTSCPTKRRRAASASSPASSKTPASTAAWWNRPSPSAATKQGPASYDDLLSYYNQRIDRWLIRDALEKLRLCDLEIQSNPAYDDYDRQYQALLKAIDPNSAMERRFLDYLYRNGLRLPDAAQKPVDGLYVRPDFYYAPRFWVFCDGTPHDRPEVRAEDETKRQAILARGDDVWVWSYREGLASAIEKRNDVFNQLK